MRIRRARRSAAGGRKEAACRLDFGPEFARVRSELRADGVRAWVPLLASRSARHREAIGCTLDWSAPGPEGDSSWRIP
jgi:hypothetical protein